MLEKIEAVLMALQELEIKTTNNNVMILAGVFNTLREIAEEGGAKDGRSEAHPE